MRIGTKTAGLAGVAALVLAAGAAQADDLFITSLKIDGATVRGDVIQKGREGWIAVQSLEYGVTSPRDPASGQATGRRVYTPVKVVLNPGPHAVLLYKALTQNSTVEVTLQSWSESSLGRSGAAGGRQALRGSLELRPAAVSGFEWAASTGPTPPTAVTVSFTPADVVVLTEGATSHQDAVVTP